MRFAYPSCCNMKMQVVSQGMITCKEPIVIFQCSNCLSKVVKEQSKCYVKDKVLLTRKVMRTRTIKIVDTPEIEDNVSDED